MTVGELIQELQQFDKDTEVYCYQIHDDMEEKHKMIRVDAELDCVKTQFENALNDLSVKDCVRDSTSASMLYDVRNQVTDDLDYYVWSIVTDEVWQKAEDAFWDKIISKKNF